MKHYYTTALFLASSASTLTPFATIASNWTVLDDMEDPAFPAWTLTHTQGVASLNSVTDRSDATNQALDLSVYTNTISDRAVACAVLPLDTPIADGATGTIYLRYWEEANGRDYNYGFSDLPITPNGNGGYSAPWDWNDFEGIIQMAPNTSILNVRDGSSYWPLTADQGITDAAIEHGIWYEIWIVITNAVGTTNDEYAIYIKGGAYTSQTLLQVQTGTASFDTSHFRNGTTESIKNVFIRTQIDPKTPNNNDPVYIDQVAQAPGVELTSGIATDLCAWSYCPDKDGYVDTGNWMGWLNVTLQPWIYSYSLKSWLYMAENAMSSHGAWVYLKK